MASDIQAYLQLCEGLIKKGLPSVEAKMVIAEFYRFFLEHRAIVDSCDTDRFQEVKNKILADLKEKEEWYEKLGYHPLPILIRDREGSEFFEAIEILSDGMREILQDNDHQVYYYAISLEVPESALPRWAQPIKWILVDNEEEARKLATESLQHVRNGRP